MQIDDDTILCRTSQLPQAELGPDDTVLLDADHGVYYGLEGPARTIWDLLESDCSLADLCTKLVERYDVDPQTCRHDTIEFVRQLAENGLVSTR